MTNDTLFNIIDRILAGDMTYMDNADEETLKVFQPYMALKWLTSTADKNSVILLNSIVNSTLFWNSDKKVLYKLMVIAMTGTTTRKTKWIYKKQEKTKKETVSVIANFFKITNRSAYEIVSRYDRDTVIEMAKLIGYNDDRIANVKKEFKNR